LTWPEADTAEKARVVRREVIMEPLYVHADEHELAATVPHIEVRHKWGGAPERPPAAGEHRRACDILDGKAGDNVAKERVEKEAEVVTEERVRGRGEALGDSGGVQLGLTHSGKVGHEELLHVDGVA
jgi:hypothetical protein